jgi:quinol monooxygenase YgiN
MSHLTVRMTLQWFVPLGEARGIAEALHGLMIGARTEPGFVHSTLTTDLGFRVSVRYVEEWATETHLRDAVTSERFARLASLMETATEPPTVAFALPGGVRGLDYVEELDGAEH